MNGFGLLVGHLVGDFIFQNDYVAANKSNPWPGAEPNVDNPLRAMTTEHREWRARESGWRMGHVVCTAHCFFYTLAVWLFSYQWMPWWGLVVCLAAHWPIDRFRLAKAFMVRLNGQEGFATGPLAPWSVIVVDNTMHLLTLYLIGFFGGA
jgi:hypothetical protein